MDTNFDILTFWDAYGIAEDIRLAIEENPEHESFERYFSVSSDSFRQAIRYPQRWTVLHEFICQRYVEFDVYGFEHHRRDMLNLVALEYRTILDGYGLKYSNPIFDKYEPLSKCHNYDEVEMRTIVGELRQMLPISRIAHETFQLLFSDRGFLLSFHKVVARAILCADRHNYPQVFTGAGRVRRAQLPGWAKRGVFFRDRGRCVKCGIDLSGSSFMGRQVHLDHIVSLADGGSNDPTNFQLLCSKCNLEKRSTSETTDRYQVYWTLEE